MIVAEKILQLESLAIEELPLARSNIGLRFGGRCVPPASWPLDAGQTQRVQRIMTPLPSPVTPVPDEQAEWQQAG